MVPYEEFWMTDFELEHLQQWSAAKNRGFSTGRPKDILVEGLGVHPEPSPDHPLIMQAGHRSGIAEFFEKRNFPYEVTAYMYQGDFTSTRNLSEKFYTKDDLQNIEEDEHYRDLINSKNKDQHDSYLINLKTRYQHYSDFKD